MIRSCLFAFGCSVKFFNSVWSLVWGLGIGEQETNVDEAVSSIRLQARSCFACSSISAALFNATSTSSWKPLKSWVRSGGVGGGVLNRPLWGLMLPSPLTPTPPRHPKRPTTSVIGSSVAPSTPKPGTRPPWAVEPIPCVAVMVVWQITEGLGKTGPGEGGVLGDRAFLG